MTFYQPFGGTVPRKWCGCLTYIYCSHVYAPPVPSTTITFGDWSGYIDDGYVGKHRKPE